ncbi:MAG TPA: hypothetical protein VKM72_02545 [Thermoanaerobaculia bacterium]|nr:hypothetical protein [Thermoanaerobaculia bacterium]
MSEILKHVFRASSAYELVLFDRLPEGERRALADLARDPDFYGVLRPREGGGSTLKSADRDTALLFLTLREPGPLPAYAAAQLGEAAPRVVARFVADGILEVERDGAFVSGPAALDLFVRPATGAPRDGRIAALSRAALRCAQALPTDDPRLLSLRLYAYNRVPLTPRWKSLLAGTPAVERHLGIAPGGPNRKTLDRAWQRLADREGWISWISRAVDGGDGRPDGPTWKLYVSPRPESLITEGTTEGAEAFGAVLEALTAARARQFKVGRDAGGLLRADKIVSYFPSFERLAEAADAVVARLAGAPAQGVPFTSEIGGEGLLSWGMDPPRSERSWSLGESWRAWLSMRLARDLLAARQAAAPGVEPWRFALDRLRLEGIDTDTWTPGALLWREG